MKKRILLFVSLFGLYATVRAVPFPISFSVSEKKIISEIPKKDKDFAQVIPGNLGTYIFTEEHDYYRDYQRSYFAITRRKGGWDCLRHYEILANGCIPYFVDLNHCSANTMHLLPKDLIWEAMHLKGVSYGHIDHTIFDYKRYYEILEKLLEYTRTHLCAANIAKHMLDSIGYQGNGSILFFANDTAPDYLKSCVIIGFKELIADRFIETPRADYLYTDFTGNPKAMYGKGFTYTRVIDDIPVDRENIEERIKNREFDLIIYGYVHHGLPLYDLVQQYYEPEKILYMCGEDTHNCSFTHLQNFFLREYY
jgi:hypothetical protein